MSRRRGTTHGALWCALALALVAGCGSQAAGPPSGASAGDSPSQSPSSDRLTLLRTCPAEAPSWTAEAQGPIPEGFEGELVKRRGYGLRDDPTYVHDLHAQYDAALEADPSVADGTAEWSSLDSWGFLMTAEEERSIWKRSEDVEPAVRAANHYLNALPDDQAGALRVDAQHGAVVVQVTRDAEHVRAELQAEVGDTAVIVVETVRYSKAELKQAVVAIQDLEGIRWTSIGAGSADGRVEVSVLGDADGPRRQIEEVIDPCMVLVTSSGPVPSPIGVEGLRGVPAEARCARVEEGLAQGEIEPVVGVVQELVRCGGAQNDEPMSVGADSDRFDQLVAALSRQSMSSGGMPCSLIGYLLPSIYAVTDDGSWLLEIPRDSCGAPYQEFLDLQTDD